jgi:hypothetical protein
MEIIDQLGILLASYWIAYFLIALLQVSLKTIAAIKDEWEQIQMRK